MVKNLPAIQETQVRSLGQEDPLEKEMATHSSILLGKFHGQRSLVGYSPWGCKESDMTEWLTLSLYMCKKEEKQELQQARNPRKRWYCSLKQEGVADLWSPANRWLCVQKDRFFQHLRKRVLLQPGKNPLCGPQSSSVHFSPSVTSDSLWPHGLRHSRLPCPSPTPRACSNSCPWSW